MFKTIIYELLKFFKLLYFFYKVRYFFTKKFYYPIIINNINYYEYNYKIQNANLPEIGDKSWIHKLKIFHNHIKRNGFINFLQNPVILDTMFVRDNSFTNREVNYLKSLNLDLKLLNENNIGNPILSKFLKNSSANLIHHATHYEKFLEFSDFNKFDYIFEFGGGYGSMARYIANRTPTLKQYSIYDLELFTILQEFYLKNLFKDTHIKFEFLSNYKDLILKNNFEKSLFISTWALSETPYELRVRFEKYILKFNFILIAFQKSVSDYNNLEYFNKLFADTKYNKNLFEIPYYKNNYYLFCKKK
tara:strand:- start:1260 stop:2171 length:912 start_codon:yes stop_codon:yes gene_type:complete